MPWPLARVSGSAIGRFPALRGRVDGSPAGRTLPSTGIDGRSRPPGAQGPADELPLIERPQFCSAARRAPCSTGDDAPAVRTDHRTARATRRARASDRRPWPYSSSCPATTSSPPTIDRAPDDQRISESILPSERSPRCVRGGRRYLAAPDTDPSTGPFTQETPCPDAVPATRTVRERPIDRSSGSNRTRPGTTPTGASQAAGQVQIRPGRSSGPSGCGVMRLTISIHMP